MSLFDLHCFQLCPRGIFIGKLKIYTIDGSIYCAKNECNTMIIEPRRHQHPSCRANRPSDIAVTVNMNAEFDLMAVNPIIQCFSRDLVTKSCQGLESRVVSTGPPFFLECLHGRSNRCLPRLPLHMHAEDIISYLIDMEHLSRNMPSQSPHPDTTLVIQNVQSLANRHNHQNHGPLGNSHLPPAKSRVSVQAGQKDTSQGGSSLPSTIQGQKSTPLSSLNNSHVADIIQPMASTVSTTLRRSINTPTATLGTTSRSTAAPGGTLETDSTLHVVSSPASGIASSPTPLSSFENLPTPMPDPEAHTIITNPLRTRATEWNQTWRYWQLRPRAVSTPRSMVSDSRCI